MFITITHTPAPHQRSWPCLLFAAERSAQLPLCSALLHMMAGPHSWVWSILRQQNFYLLKCWSYNLLPIVRKQKRNNNSGSCRLYPDFKTLPQLRWGLLAFSHPIPRTSDTCKTISSHSMRQDAKSMPPAGAPQPPSHSDFSPLNSEPGCNTAGLRSLWAVSAEEKHCFRVRDL